MQNIKDAVYDAIKDITENIGDTYASIEGRLPAIEYVEEENKVYQWADNKEQSSVIRFRFDIWANVSTSSLALAVDECVAGLGFKRIQCQDVDDESGIKHKLMRYEGIINSKNNRVTHI